MQTRRLVIRFGDIGHQSHGRTLTLALELTGEDVTMEALYAARKRAQEATGRHLDDLFGYAEDGALPIEALQSFTAAKLSFTSAPGPAVVPFSFILSSGERIGAAALNFPEGQVFDAIALSMSYFGYGIEGFSWRQLEEDVIVHPTPLPAVHFESAPLRNPFEGSPALEVTLKQALVERRGYPSGAVIWWSFSRRGFMLSGKHEGGVFNPSGANMETGVTGTTQMTWPSAEWEEAARRAAAGDLVLAHRSSFAA